ncbi:MAG: acyl dehydratase [Porticoccaceae bacterium]|nr:acyl dehydratase [Porticoccaceae bacterium]|tara:strand:+ start:477 stop:887 length:411 start_codon:yes stop_codon:yes gene_type:complete
MRANLPSTLLSSSLSVAQDLIDRFAELADDYNPIHTDPDFAKDSPMGQIIAHGSLSIGLIWNSIEKTLFNKWLIGASLDVRLRRPVYLGDDIVSAGVLRSDGYSYDVWVSNQRGDQVIKGIFIIRKDIFIGDNRDT